MSIPGPVGHGLQLAPFRALRYVPERVGSLAAVTSPPYDVVVRPDGLRALETADPYNIVRLILPQADTPAEIAEITNDLAQHQALIADGHHRWATYLRLRAEHPEPGPWDYGLVLLVDTARYPLRVRAIHRLLRLLPPSTALEALGGAFRVRTVEGPLPRALEALDAAAAEGAHGGAGPFGGTAFLLAGEGRFHLLDRPDPELLARTVPADRPAAWRTLDATVLHSVLLEHLWKVPDDPAHIGYIHDAAAAVDQAERHGGTAVLLRPVQEDVVHELARQGVAMPHKSTSFGPKPATGLVLRSLALG
ncbi:DUF1015 family protein [Streptomyces palmae]|uniref:DUF1015 family protein n=1 Tax=Streptomyces palmae TaxID=1701085 RepID=A0A4Z0G000_9ACTN|nr:DUF1015 family protein [Streptomyces palmae]TGA88987.1 DUF1015 family protein [Streptomyces palmae]